MAALGGDLYRTVLGGLYSVFLRGILFVVTDVFPTTVSAGRLFATRFLGAFYRPDRGSRVRAVGALGYSAAASRYYHSLEMLVLSTRQRLHRRRS